jgi:hypothetical protein
LGQRLPAGNDAHALPRLLAILDARRGGMQDARPSNIGVGWIV